ncbi:hypothetical protein [Streptomyces sp. NBC_01618]|uniref:hypothetical protein n=1 Tax=Streptomyces sp. NBC_01618 TaxID=2975900 RepID=UPI003865548C|nr:hypothetical protein OH735_23875 [Streptomyces sp. NBC_01618]
MTSDREAGHSRHRPPGLGLDARLARIGWTGERRPTAEVLHSVHRAHALGNGTREERQLTDGDEVLRVLAADFDIRLPRGTRLPE